MNPISNLIKTWRLKRKLSQLELAQKLGVVQSRVSHMEKVGIDKLNIGTLSKVAQALGARLKITFVKLK